MESVVGFDDFDDFRADSEDKDCFANLENFEAFLAGRKFAPEERYGGLFETDVTVCRFFDSGKNGEKFLADIERKNAEQNMGNITIPNTKIKLINYSVCPQCKTVFSYKDLADYYKNPRPDPLYKNKGHQLRQDTRVHCSECGTYFLPALVISDGTPRNEVQFLCKMQTVNAVENFFQKKGRTVLSKKRTNLSYGKGFIAVRNDVMLRELEEKPTLITNMLQYTPADFILNLIDGSNVEKGDTLFGKWKPL
jgi:hypothetical protein